MATGSFDMIVLVGKVFGVDMNYTPDGKPRTTVRIGTSKKVGEKYQNKWFKVTFWGKTAETAAQLVTKNAVLRVTGELQADENGNPRVWTDKKTGDPKTSFELTGRDFNVIVWGDKEDGATQSKPAYDPDEEVPF